MPRSLIYLLALIAVAGLLLFLPLPIPPTFWGRTIENSGHTPLFFVLTLGVIYVLREFPVVQRHWWTLYVLGGLIGVGGGFVSELVQRWLARDASWDDVIADAAGVLLALSAYAFFDRRLRPWPPVRWASLLTALTCLAIYSAPIVTMLRAYWYRNGQFPVIASFSSRAEMYWVIGIGARREIVNGALDVEFVAQKFPAVSFHEPVQDWRPYKSLLIDVENPADMPLDLAVRVNDLQHNRHFNDRFNRHYALAGSERRTLKIDIEDIRRGPRSRLMDMGHISNVMLFRGNNEGSNRLRIHSLRLE